MSIKAVIFDLDGTLIRRSLNYAEVFCRILGLKGISKSIEEVNLALNEVREEFEDISDEKCGKIPLSEFHYLWSSRILAALGIEDCDRIISNKVTEQWVSISCTRADPDAEPLLQFVRRRGMKTAIVSSIYQQEIEKMLEMGGLDRELFDVIVGTDTIQRKKPDPEIFRYALENLGIRPEEALYVGDDLEKDYRAAEKVGMIPLFLARREDDVPKDVRGITSLRSVIDYLGFR